MKVVDTKSKKTYYGTMLENIDGNINIYNHYRVQIATVPSSQAKLIFNESEIPYMEV